MNNAISAETGVFCSPGDKQTKFSISVTGDRDQARLRMGVKEGLHFRFFESDRAASKLEFFFTLDSP